MSDLENYSVEELEIMLAIARKKRGVTVDNQLAGGYTVEGYGFKSEVPAAPVVLPPAPQVFEFPKVEPVGFIDKIFHDTLFYSRFGESNKFNFFILPGTETLLANGYEWEFQEPVSRAWHNGVQCWITHNFIDGTYLLNREGKDAQKVSVKPKGRHR